MIFVSMISLFFFFRGVARVVSLALGFFKSFFVRSFFFCSLKSFLSSGNIYYLYDETIVNILVGMFFFRFSFELSSLLEVFLRSWVGFTCFSAVGKVLFTSSLNVFPSYPAFWNGLSRICYIFSSRLGISSSLFQWLIYPLQTFLGIPAQYLRWCLF